MVRQARTPRAGGGAAWLRLFLLLFALVGLLVLQDRLGLAGASCFSNLTGPAAPAEAPVNTPTTGSNTP